MAQPLNGVHIASELAVVIQVQVQVQVCVCVCVCVCVWVHARVYVCGGILEVFIALSAFWVFLQVPKISKKNGGPFLKQ